MQTCVTIYRLICDSCRKSAKIEGKTRSDAHAAALKQGWAFGSKAACHCKACKGAK